MYYLTKYQGTKNLGDAIQSIAISRFFNNPKGIFRNHFPALKNDDIMIINGYVNYAKDISNALYAGIFVEPSENAMITFDALKKSKFTVGARDPFTYENCVKNGINCEMIGCATLTFEKYTGIRSGTYYIDYPDKESELTQKIGNLRWDQQWELAIKRLDLIQKAEMVFTSRLHIALPCLAFGTPVVIAKPENIKYADRFSLIEHMKLPYNEEVTINTLSYAERFMSFLKHHLGISGILRNALLFQ